tara:strand:- start:45 stop:848 length:804 start_codon:yes stop_codon:yes gene_type:complete
MAYTITSGTIADKVIAILGEENTDYLDDMVNLDQLFEDAIWDIASSLPKRMLMRKAATPVDPTNLYDGSTWSSASSTPVAVDDDMILLVIRVAANHIMDGAAISTERYIQKPCKEVAYEDSFKALDSASIFYATDSSPVYWVESDSSSTNKLKTAPTTTGWENTNAAAMANGSSGIQVWIYHRQTVSATDTATTGWNVFTSISGVQEESEDIFIKRIALKIAERKLATMATQEEDTELYQLLQGLVGTLTQELKDGLMKLQQEWESK